MVLQTFLDEPVRIDAERLDVLSRLLALADLVRTVPAGEAIHHSTADLLAQPLEEPFGLDQLEREESDALLAVVLLHVGIDGLAVLAAEKSRVFENGGQVFGRQVRLRANGRTVLEAEQLPSSRTR